LDRGPAVTTTPAAAPTFDLGPYAHDVRLTNTVIDGRDRYAIFNLDPISNQLPTRVYVFPHGQHYTALSGRAEYHGATEGWIPTGLATIACGDTPADALALILGPVIRTRGGGRSAPRISTGDGAR